MSLFGKAESVKFAGGSSGELLLTRLLMGRMDLWCLPVRSEIPLFTWSAHVNKLNREVVLHLRKWDIKNIKYLVVVSYGWFLIRTLFL